MVAIIFIIVLCVVCTPIYMSKSIENKPKWFKKVLIVYVVFVIIYIIGLILLSYRMYEQEQAIKELLAYSCA